MKQLTVLTGQNEILKLTYLEEILKNFEGDDVKVIYLDEASSNFLSGELEGYSLFSTRRLFVIKNFDGCNSSIKREVKEKLINFVSRDVSDTFVVILLEDNIFGENERIDVIDFKKFYRNDILSYIRKRLNEEGVLYEPDIVEYLSDLSCDNFESVIKMLDIILSYYEKDKKLTVEVIGSLFTREKGYSVFDLIDGIFTKDRKKAYTALQDLKDSKESAIQINYMIYRTAKLMWSFLGDKNKANLEEKLKIKPFEIKKLAFYSSKVDLKFISSVLSLVKRVEIVSKTMSVDFAFLEIEKFILSF
ncbi:MAG: DNA polymerase III subunit delta [Brevinematia bacterium]